MKDKRQKRTITLDVKITCKPPDDELTKKIHAHLEAAIQQLTEAFRLAREHANKKP